MSFNFISLFLCTVPVYIFIISFSTSVLFSRRTHVTLVDLIKIFLDILILKSTKYSVCTCENRLRYSRERASQSLEVIQFISSIHFLGTRTRGARRWRSRRSRSTRRCSPASSATRGAGGRARWKAKLGLTLSADGFLSDCLTRI